MISKEEWNLRYVSFLQYLQLAVLCECVPWQWHGLFLRHVTVPVSCVKVLRSWAIQSSVLDRLYEQVLSSIQLDPHL